MSMPTKRSSMPTDPPAFLPPRQPTPAPRSASQLFRSTSAKLSTRNDAADPLGTSSGRASSERQRPASSDGIQWPRQTPSEQVPALSRTHSSNSRRTSSLRSPSVRVSSECSLSRASSLRDPNGLSRRSSLDTLHEVDRSPVLGATDEGLPGLPPATLSNVRRSAIEKRSSLRHMSRPSDDDLEALSSPLGIVTTTSSDPGSPSKKSRPKSHPQSESLHSTRNDIQPDPNRASLPVQPDDWPLPSMMFSETDMPDLGLSLPIRPKPSFKRLSSLDHVLNYREERNSWKRESYIRSQAPSIQEEQHELDDLASAEDQADPPPAAGFKGKASSHQHVALPELEQSRFRHQVVEVGFCFTIAMTQFLAEYLISGFAVILPSLFGNATASARMTGMFWPAALLSLILSATLLVWARISDMYGGYFPFMLGLLWLTIWTVVPGFFPTGVLLDISRAMQGLAIAAFTPSTFTMVGSIYGDSTRKNHVLGLYGACAPLGFYSGFLVGGALPDEYSHWYFWIAALLSFVTLITAYLTVPADKIDRKKLNLSMDWLGAFLITSGLILVAYALAVEPYVNVSEPARSGFAFPGVYAPLVCGVVCLVAAVWVETKYARCPLVPKDFFRPQGVKWFCAACMFFYAAYGAWLYNSAEFFANSLVAPDVKPIMLSLWYTPMAIGGVVFCVIGSRLIESVPVKIMLGFSGMAWVGSSLVFAVGPLPLNYWEEVMPSMICSTIGLDLTFTISTIFLSRVQPMHYQGVAGAASSILINLAMSFSLPISSIVRTAAEGRVNDDTLDPAPDATVWGFRAAFMYGAASGAVGLMICMAFVKISRNVMKPQATFPDEERPEERGVTSSEAPTLFHA